MEAGNGDQVSQTGGPQHLPIRIIQCTGITYRQGLHVTRRLPANRLANPRRHAFAPCLQASRRRQLLCRLRSNQAACDNPLRQRVPLGIETTGVGQATRRTQPQRESPTCTGTQAHARPRLLGVKIVIPRQLQLPSPQRRQLIIGIVDTETEARAAWLDLRQRHHRADNRDFAAFQQRRQLRVQRPTSMQRRPAGASQRGPHPSQPMPAPPRKQAEDQQAPPHPTRWQCRRPQDDADTGNNTGGHGLAECRQSCRLLPHPLQPVDHPCPLPSRPGSSCAGRP